MNSRHLTRNAKLNKLRMVTEFIDRVAVKFLAPHALLEEKTRRLPAGFCFNTT
jgi:hypothetical protein